MRMNSIVYNETNEVSEVLHYGILMQPERAVRAWVGAQLYMFGIRIPKPQAPGPGQGLVISTRRETERCSQ